MKRAERNRLILESIEASGRVQIAQIAHEANVSEMTVRRDLENLEGLGALTRVHGGAIAPNSRSNSPAFHARELRKAEEKQRMGAVVASLIREGESIVIDAGTTTVHVANALQGRRGLRVLALDLRVADALSDQPQMRVMVPGGTIRPIERALYGPETERTLAEYNFDTFVMSAAGVDLGAGFTEYNPEDAAVKRAALASARRTIVVADGAKVDTIAFARVCWLAEVDVVVTDQEGYESATLVAARENGLHVIGA